MVRTRRPSRRLKPPAIAVAWVALCVLVASMRSVAYAGSGRVVVIDVDPRVAEALVVALSPWGLTIVRAPGPSPAPDVDAAAAHARVIASDLHAGAVVWIAPPRPPVEQATLWVYDAQTLELAVRPLTVWAPYDEAGAAAVALSVKTVLRASPLVTPDSSSGEAPGPTPSASSPRLESAPTPAMPPAAAAANVPSSSRDAWRFETFIGARSPTGASAAVEARMAVGASLWPARFGEHAGLGVDVQAGPGVSIGTDAFQGELRSGLLELTGRVRTSAAQRLAIELDAGPALVLASLDGQTLPEGMSVHALRLDPSLDFGVVVDLALGSSVSLGAAVTGSALLRFQRYSLDRATLLDGPAVVVLYGLRLSLEVD